MIDKIKRLGGDELVRGSFLLFVMIVIFNLLNYVFQMSMARMLGPADYGILAVLMSFIYIFSIPSESIQTVITKYTSEFNAGKKFGKIRYLLSKGIRKSLLFASIIYVLLIPVAFFLSSYLKIESSLILITFLFIFYVFTLPLIRGVIQGQKKFFGLGLSLIIESAIKVIFSIMLVIIGWRVYGALIGLFMGSTLALIISVFMIREVLSAKKEGDEFKDIYRNSIPIVVSMIALTVMYSFDIILARRFFSPEIAGQFAFVSLIGKTIFFVSSAIGKTMFPMIAEDLEEGKKKSSKLFRKSILIVGMISIFALMLYFFWPREIIQIISLGSDQYLPSANILFILGVAYSFLSLCNIVLLYGISRNRLGKRSYTLLIFAGLQLVVLFIFNNNTVEYSLALMFSNLLILLYSVWITRK